MTAWESRRLPNRACASFIDEVDDVSWVSVDLTSKRTPGMDATDD